MTRLSLNKAPIFPEVTAVYKSESPSGHRRAAPLERTLGISIQLEWSPRRGMAMRSSCPSNSPLLSPLVNGVRLRGLANGKKGGPDGRKKRRVLRLWISFQVNKLPVGVRMVE